MELNENVNQLLAVVGLSGHYSPVQPSTKFLVIIGGQSESSFGLVHQTRQIETRQKEFSMKQQKYTNNKNGKQEMKK